MPTYSIIARVVAEEHHNVQDWTTTWSQIETDIGRLDGEVVDAYAVLGDYDFQIVYEAPDEESALRIAVAVEQHGLDAKTNQLIDVDRFGDIVEDV